MNKGLRSRAMLIASQFGLHSPLGQFIVQIATKVDGTQSGETSLGWRDIIGTPILQNAGSNLPTFEYIAGSVFGAEKYSLNDERQFNYHIQHDYAEGTDILLHVHWLSDGTDVNPVKWEFTYAYAKGFDQQNYDLSGTVVTVEQAPPGTPFRHMTSEIAVPVSNPDFEPDGIMMVRLRRVTNGALDNGDNIFVETADLHYQSNRLNTPNRVPPFT